MVLPDSHRVSRAPRYSGTGFESGAFSPTRLSRSLAPLSSGIRLTPRLMTLLLPALQPPGAAEADQDLGCADFARHYFRHRGFFLLLRVLRWFTSPGSLRSAYAFSRGLPRVARQGFPIRRSPDQSLFAAPRSLSQLSTSFIACWRQGIHRTPLVAFSRIHSRHAAAGPPLLEAKSRADDNPALSNFGILPLRLLSVVKVVPPPLGAMPDPVLAGGAGRRQLQAAAAFGSVAGTPPRRRRRVSGTPFAGPRKTGGPG